MRIEAEIRVDEHQVIQPIGPAGIDHGESGFRVA